ncbi:MAG TPA: hypothetical protein VFP69_00120, partial [Streptomyces sp.]|nr:hypothetical protein [Streptomyces sp.]
LLVKLGLVALLVALGRLSRRWTGRLAAGDAPTGSGGAGGPDSEDSEGPRDSGDAGEDTQVETSPGPPPSGTDGPGSPGSLDGPDGSDGSDGPGSPERAAQLARQRAAVAAARRKRLRDADPNRFGLRRSVLAEATVAALVLLATTLLTQTEPGRTEQDARAAVGSASSGTTAPPSGTLTLDLPFDTGGKNGKGRVRIELDPARPGSNEMHVYAERPNGRAFDLPEVKIALTLESQDIGPLPVVPDHITTGHWSASGVQLPMAGDWTVDVTVRTSDIDQVTVSKNAQIG